MTEPLVSIITTSYNDGEFLRQNIESVLNQGYTNFEHIVVDGGSTDDTIEILKSYSHLQWKSEPDRGQSHALNKGFASASGEIIGWLNSDDWYAPNVFHTVVRALQHTPIVMGACAFVDKHGTQIKTVPNIERNFFDILKYWVYDSSPAQPSIFFRRDFLEATKLDQGIYVDESLEYCMDYDLWLRMARKTDFSTRIPISTAHFRAYEDGKTGRDPEGTYEEAGRVFKRHTSFQPEASQLSIIVPYNDDPEALALTLNSISSELEVILVSHNSAQSQLDHFGNSPNICVLSSRSSDPLQQLGEATLHTSHELVAWLFPGDTIDAHFAQKVTQAFEIDSVGMLMLLHSQPALMAAFQTQEAGQLLLEPNGIFELSSLCPRAVVRKSAFNDCGGLSSNDSNALQCNFAAKKLLLWLVHKAWKLIPDASIPIGLSTKVDLSLSQIEIAKAQSSNLQLLKEMVQELDRDPFARLRLEHGFGFPLAPEIQEQLRNMGSTSDE